MSPETRRDAIAFLACAPLDRKKVQLKKVEASYLDDDSLVNHAES